MGVHRLLSMGEQNFPEGRGQQHTFWLENTKKHYHFSKTLKTHSIWPAKAGQKGGSKSSPCPCLDIHDHIRWLRIKTFKKL